MKNFLKKTNLQVLKRLQWGKCIQYVIQGKEYPDVDKIFQVLWCYRPCYFGNPSYINKKKMKNKSSSALAYFNGSRIRESGFLICGGYMRSNTSTTFKLTVKFSFVSLLIVPVVSNIFLTIEVIA